MTIHFDNAHLGAQKVILKRLVWLYDPKQIKVMVTQSKSLGVSFPITNLVTGYDSKTFSDYTESITPIYDHNLCKVYVNRSVISGVFLGFPPWVPPCFAPPAAEGGREILVVFFAKANQKIWEI